MKEKGEVFKKYFFGNKAGSWTLTGSGEGVSPQESGKNISILVSDKSSESEGERHRMIPGIESALNFILRIFSICRKFSAEESMRARLVRFVVL